MDCNVLLMETKTILQKANTRWKEGWGEMKEEDSAESELSRGGETGTDIACS